jgi:hypothetical protein
LIWSALGKPCINKPKKKCFVNKGKRYALKYFQLGLEEPIEALARDQEVFYDRAENLQ